MKQFFSLPFLILIFAFSCKSVNNNKIASDSGTQKAGTTDTTKAKEGKRDNFIIDNTYDQSKEAIYMFCENMPQFPGGENAFFEYMRTNINYPKPAIAEKTEGRVVVKFIINSNGEPVDVQVIRKKRPDMNDECIRAVQAMPKWKPGMLNGKPVSVSYNVTVRFLLNKSENLHGIYILPSKIR
jgi:TonB family protein